MKCSDLETFCAGYHDGTLTIAQCRGFHRHLSECYDCLTHCMCYQWVLMLLREERERLHAQRDLGDVMQCSKNKNSHL